MPRAVQRKISRRALFARDGWRCVYCGTTNGRLTLDHVVPRSRGGESIWENVVTACAPCNHKKGNRTLEEAGLHLRHLAEAAEPVLFIKLAAPRVPKGWAPYLGSELLDNGRGLAVASPSSDRRRAHECARGVRRRR